MITSREAVEELLDRIETADVHTNAVCTLHPDALGQAEALDAESAAGRTRSPLHGRAILVKDNVDTHDLPTTAGSLALADVPPPARDAALVQRLRAAGMVVLGKTNLSEWANIRDGNSASGWSAYGGLTRNPYGLNRSAGGSSSGSGAALAAGLAPFAIGTETDGSISCPAAFNGCVGFKPTVGLVPTAGVVPISSSQDSPGPMAMTVRDAAALLSVLADDGVDYAAHAVPGRLAGKRIGVPRATYWGYSPHADAAAERAVALLAAEGATIVDHTDLPEIGEQAWADELTVLLAELRHGLAGYLAGRPGDVPRTLEEVVQYNRDHADLELAHFGQSLFEQALEGPTVDDDAYREARDRCVALTRTDGIDKILHEHGLDALVTPSYAPAAPIDLVNPEAHPGSCTSATAMAGYPLLTVPTELAAGLPVAVSFWGASGSERTLVEIAHGYELARDRSTGPLPEPTFPTFV
ncbi:amidase [Nocardioides ginsengisegetis]|uniref:Amidase n=1 Tax=Nocardioides ginsengisegetis TaxID=661491 RepID=A0A7W3IY28_9ACTN|nr:amidase family protein [Nocardioides ginsengisegetis]MBA8802748.1 amidase [Nocardioides ginsengisegetis]